MDEEQKEDETYIIELIKMDETSLVKRLSDDTIWYLNILAPLNRRKWENITK